MHNLNDRADSIIKALDCLRIVTPIDEEVANIIFMEWADRITVLWDQWDYQVAELDDEAKRAAALAFLGTWARRFTKLGATIKEYGDDYVSVTVDLACGWQLEAKASAEVVCRYELVLDDDGEEVMEDQEVTEYGPAVTVIKPVPKRQRICPPSFLQGASL